MKFEPSTLEYLDSTGTVVNFALVPYKTLNDWLSALNGNPHIEKCDVKGVNRGKVLEELETRRKSKGNLLGAAMKTIGIDKGYGSDWREYENDQGVTHLEELLLYQPKEWRKQAREYKFGYEVDLHRKSPSPSTGRDFVTPQGVKVVMDRAILVVLFHPELSRASRYEPLNFLLAYEVADPLPELMKVVPEDQKLQFIQDLSPLDYFFEFAKHVDLYDVNGLLKIGKEQKCPRLCLINEIDFSNIVGQRTAKLMLRQAILTYVHGRFPKNRFCSSKPKPLSLMFAGPSGNGKTELAKWLAELLNKPESNYFHKVDCGKLSDASEMFGLAGAYYGSKHGSGLNNFVLEMSMEHSAIGIVLLDEIEKADQSVIHALYQVLDKGEWTNKKLDNGNCNQTETIPCHNIIFIMTTNACDYLVKSHKDIPFEYDQELGFMDVAHNISKKLTDSLMNVHPFTREFIGRISKAIPFFPVANGHPDRDPLIKQEMATVIKVLIEKEQEKLSDEVKSVVTTKTKHDMTKEVLERLNIDTGVRSAEMVVQSVMSEKVLHNLLLSKGGISKGSTVNYYVHGTNIDMRSIEKGMADIESEEFDRDNMNEIWG